jgi:hypothetical protein
MMQPYQIPLINEKISLYNRIGFIAIFINLLVFLFFSIYIAGNRISIACGISSMAIAGCLLFNAYQQSKPDRHIDFIFIYGLIVGGWFAAGVYWLGIMAVLFAFLSTIATRKLIVSFSEELIIYPSFPKKKMKWDDLSNVVLKDGLLTIDHKNNKLIQQEIDSTMQKTDEGKFNEFCRQQLRRQQPANKPNKWDAMNAMP